MNRNYQKELDRIIQKRGKRMPRVLLHSCCGPCSSSVLEYLTQYFDVTLLWYNPNIYPKEEFDRRFKTQVQLIESMGLADKVSVLAEPWKSADYYARIKGLENEPEGGTLRRVLQAAPAGNGAPRQALSIRLFLHDADAVAP